MLQPSKFRSSIRLYGLVKDGVGQPSVVFSVPSANGSNAIQAFVSRLDAEIAARTYAHEGYQVRPFSQCFDPNPHLPGHQGWLIIHICCGFAAHHKHLQEVDGRLVPMGWFTYADIGEWTPGHYLHWGEQLPRQLQALYDKAGLRNYNALLNELDDVCATEMRWHTDEALDTMPARFPSDETPSQFALFDAIECCWCFANSNTDVHEPHTNTPPQGALS